MSLKSARTLLGLHRIPLPCGGLSSVAVFECGVSVGCGLVARRQLSVCAHVRQLQSDAGDAEKAKVARELIDKYAKYQSSPLTIKQFLDFGLNACPEESYLFLRHELPVRLAAILREIQFLPSELRNTEGCNQIKHLYQQSFLDLMSYVDKPFSDDILDDFTKRLINIRDRHADLVPVMANAVMEVKKRYPRSGPNKSKFPKFEANIQYFLDRLYTSRMSSRMLINQHALLFSKDSSKEDMDTSKVVGALEKECLVVPIAERAYDNARFLAEQYYMAAPEMKIRSFDLTAIDNTTASVKLMNSQEHLDPIHFTYVPSHLYHILFEIFKNAMRATIEYHGEDCVKFPPLKCLIVKSPEDMTIRISDKGGGISKRDVRKVFKYLYTTANPVHTSSAGEGVTSMLGQAGVPLAGYGYGLPLSRLYARYFSGDLSLQSIQGYGTEATLTLQTQPSRARERLPNYHEAGSRKIYESQLVADDWTVDYTKEGDE